MDHQATEIVASSPLLPALGGREFENWVRETRQKLEHGKTPPKAIAEAVQDRLQNERFVTDSTVMEAVNAWTYYESQQEGAVHAVNRVQQRYPETFRFMSSIEPLIFGRKELQSRLLMKKATLARNVNDLTNSVQNWKAATELLQPLSIEVDRMRMESIVELAGGYYASGANEEAQSWYLKAMSFPWYLVENDAASLEFLRGKYVEAARGLIECRRGNLQALKEIFFVPATKEELKPLLDVALKEAEHSSQPQ